MILSSTGCDNQKSIVVDQESKITESNIDSTSLLEKDSEEEDKDPVFLMKTKILCDSIYGKDYKVELEQFSEKVSYMDSVYNSIFTFSIKRGDSFQVLRKDSVQSHFCHIKFEDFNNDSIKDILVENTSDARSNLTYYLYLMDTVNNELNKIHEFQKIKNPNYISEHDIIDNYVFSGANWTCFYSIKGDSIYEYDVCIEDDQRNNNSYSPKHQKALDQVLDMK